MDFDIHQLDHRTPDSEGSDMAFEDFQQALLERFSQSPEGQSVPGRSGHGPLGRPLDGLWLSI